MPDSKKEQEAKLAKEKTQSATQEAQKFLVQFKPLVSLVSFAESLIEAGQLEGHLDEVKARVAKANGEADEAKARLDRLNADIERRTPKKDEIDADARAHAAELKSIIDDATDKARKTVEAANIKAKSITNDAQVRLEAIQQATAKLVADFNATTKEKEALDQEVISIKAKFK